MEIFTIENGMAKPSVHSLLIEPFKEIWESDDSPNKGNAIAAFTYIEFMCSPKKSNIFFSYPEDIRGEKIKEKLADDFEVTELIEEAIKVYNKYLEEASYSYSFLLSARSGAEKLKKFFNDVDLNERNDKGGLIFKVSDMTNALKSTENILTNLQNLEKKVFEELKSTKTKANKEINDFER